MRKARKDPVESVNTHFYTNPPDLAGFEHLRQGGGGYHRRELREYADSALLCQRAGWNVAVCFETHWSAGGRAHRAVKDPAFYGVAGVLDDDERAPQH